MLEILKEHRWVLDILDITLMSIILYRLLLIVKGTKAAQMMIGLGNPAPCLTGFQVP